eukprot:862208-Rhodomonas_salina.3
MEVESHHATPSPYQQTPFRYSPMRTALPDAPSLATGAGTTAAEPLGGCRSKEPRPGPLSPPRKQTPKATISVQQTGECH